LQESANGGAWTPKYSGSGHSKAFSGRSIGSYRYRVRAYNRVTGYGAWSAIKTETVSAPAVPGGLRASPNPSHNGAWSVSWNGAAGAGSYRLQESANGGAWTPKYNSTGHSWSTSNRANGSYRYRVRTYDSVTGYSAWSAAASETEAWIPATPANFHRVTPPAVVKAGTNYVLAWSAAAHATSYQLAGGGTRPTETGIGGTSRSETAPAQGGVTVTWRLRACGPGGCSAWSAPLKVSTIPVVQKPCPRPPCKVIGPYAAAKGSSVEPASGSGPGALTVKTNYNANGYPEKLTRASDGYGYVTVNAMDAYGHASALTEGNGARVMRAYDQATGLALQTRASSRAHGLIADLTTAWDGFGNLKTRTATDPATNITRTERASYDDLNRLKQTVLTLKGGGRRTLTFAYGDNGNRTQKCVNGRCTTYGYGGSAGPHALTSVNGAGNYDYDANGAMLHDGDKTLAWSAFGKAMYIGTQQGTVGFAYGPDRARYQKRVNSAYGEAETVTYLQGAERLQFANGQQRIRRTLAFAGVTVIDTGGVGAKVLYAVKDHLGSTMALSDATGGLAQQMSYSPFGTRKTAGWAHGMDIPTAWQINTTETDKGYTGQESLDAVQLVDYNARLYDPALGRFLSVDPLIAHPGSTQSINPYSYVENNPLNKTDPTGEAGVDLGCNSAGSHLCNGGAQGSWTGPNEAAHQIHGLVKAGILSANLGKTLTQGLGGHGVRTGANFSLAVAGAAAKRVAANANFNVSKHSPNRVGVSMSPAQRRAVDEDFRNQSKGIESVAPSLYFIGGIEVKGAELLGDGAEIAGKAILSEVEKLVGEGGAKEATTVIGKLDDLKNLRSGEQTMLGRLHPNLGSPKANWMRNSSVLREAMSRGLPIRDATVDPSTGALMKNTGFLKAERNLLNNHGWKYDPNTTMWNPPAGP
jgi:RHS repeat-associated protein